MRAAAGASLQADLAQASAEQCFQFERLGYFVADRVDSQAGTPAFNRLARHLGGVRNRFGESTRGLQKV